MIKGKRNRMKGMNEYNVTRYWYCIKECVVLFKRNSFSLNIRRESEYFIDGGKEIHWETVGLEK